MIGKHSEESIKIKQLEETIRLRNQEIKDIKNSVADILLRIKILNESNSYGDPSIKKRKISELCTDTRYELLIDETYKKEKTYYRKDKIKELSSTNQSEDSSND